MSPLWVVGLLIITLLSPIHADVKHVLDGTAHPPQCKCSQTQYHQQVPNYVPQPNNIAPGSPALWWTDTHNSPFKHAYEYFKKCSVTGGCVTPVAGNPQALPQTQNHISEESRFGFESIKKNPFLSGQVPAINYENSNSVFSNTNENNNKIDISQNPFFNKDQTTFSASGQSVPNTNGFIGVQPNVPFNNQNKPQTNFGFGGNYQQPKRFENCKDKEYVCVTSNQCLNGVVQVYGEQLLNLKTSTDYCEVGKEVCCRLPNLSSAQQATHFDSYTASKTTANNINFGFANLSEFTSGKGSVPGAKINFGGNAGLSPGSIQVLPIEDNTPTGSLGQNDALAAAGSSYNNKVVRNTSPNPNLIFGSTRDYSNEKYDKYDFQSQFAGPQYLPPLETKTQKPVISTYQPTIPTTSRPYTRPPYVPSESIISIHTNPPFVPSSPQPFTFPPTTRQPFTFPPSTRQPFTFAPTTKQPVTYYQPKVTTSRNEYLPPSTPKPFVFSTTKAPVYTFPTNKPTTPKLYTVKPYSPPSTTASPIAQPSQTVNRVTPGYNYPKPTPSFELPPSSRQPYVPPKTTQYIPPRTTQYVPPRTTQYIPPKISTVGYQYEKPLTGESSFQINNQYVTSSTARPTNGYVYNTPTPAFHYPTPDNTNTVTNLYIPPVTSSTSGYSYYTPSSTFTYPPIRTAPPTQKPSSPNQYLPPVTGEGTNEKFYYETTIKPNTYIPPSIIDSGTSVDIKFATASCAAALRCVPLDFCTAQGTISQTRVVLTKEQHDFRVPTTQCFDKETQVSGYCCRDPDYVDPWPSANLLNGEDDGKYREDSNLGQYFPKQQRVIRSKVERSSNDLVSNTRFQQSPKRVTIAAKDENTCGIRHKNTIPEGKGPIDVNFAEIPWQAMILRDSNRSLLCGGVIIKRNVVLTAAHCVEGIATSDVLIKGGEWKLGIDEEPLPFQIVKVSAIVRHPNFKAGILQNDLALLILQENLNLANNIAPICLPSANQPPPTKCIATGWGKRILQAHLRNAIMRSINISILDSKQCSDVISNKYQHVLQDYSPSTICGYSSNDQCDVDYGSALACTSDDNQYTLSGIFSWDTGCKDQSQIGGYIAPDYEWIESISSKPLTQLKDLDRQYRRQ